MNELLKQKINFLKELGIDTMEVQVTNLGDWSIKLFDGRMKQEILNANDDTLKYFQIGDEIVIDSDLNEIIYDCPIKRSAISFHQCDDAVRVILYNILINVISKLGAINTITFVGGEMYIFGVVLNKYYENASFYSNFESLIQDTCKNVTNPNVNLVDYNKDDICFGDSDMMICNLSKSDFTQNLCSCILKSNIPKILVISCNVKGFDSVYDMMKCKYFRLDTIIDSSGSNNIDVSLLVYHQYVKN